MVAATTILLFLSVFLFVFLDWKLYGFIFCDLRSLYKISVTLFGFLYISRYADASFFILYIPFSSLAIFLAFLLSGFFSNCSISFSFCEIKLFSLFAF